MELLVKHKYLKNFVKRNFGKVRVKETESDVFFYKGFFISVHVWEFKGKLKVYYTVYKTDYNPVYCKWDKTCYYKPIYKTYDINSSVMFLQKCMDVVKKLTNYNPNIFFTFNGEFLKFEVYPTTYEVDIRDLQEVDLEEFFTNLFNLKRVNVIIT